MSIKRIVTILLLMMVMLVPSSINAEIKVLDLEDTLKDKEIEPAFDNYEENDKQVTIYLFRWADCSHCYDFLSYLNSITNDYGYMFKLRSYEVSENQDNAEVYAKVSKYFKHTETGVPYIVIGKETFYGYGESYNEDIIKAIKKEYESEDKFDVFYAIENGVSLNSEKSNKALIILIPLLVVVVGTIIFVIVRKED